MKVFVPVKCVIDYMDTSRGVQTAAEAAPMIDCINKFRLACNAIYVHQLDELMGASLVELADDCTKPTIAIKMELQNDNIVYIFSLGLIKKSRIRIFYYLFFMAFTIAMIIKFPVV